MYKYILKKFIIMLITVITICTITFFLVHSIPGSPFFQDKKNMGPMLTRLNEKYGFDKPVSTQYWIFVKNLLHGDLGSSISKRIPVKQIILSGLPNSMHLGIVAIIFIILTSFPLGIIAALNKGKFIDKLISGITSFGLIMPGFVLGAFILYIFCERLMWLPIGGLSSRLHYIGPVLTISFFDISFTTKLMRSSMIDVLASDYVRTAKTFGFSRKEVVLKHALKNALGPVITYLGPTIGTILSGTFIAEKLFAIAGVGQYFVDTIMVRDYPIIMGMSILCSVFYVLSVFLVDLCYMITDPKIRLK
ncbi:MAG: ABC transporter permease [Oscillospiraceae bacterium]